MQYWHKSKRKFWHCLTENGGTNQSEISKSKIDRVTLDIRRYLVSEMDLNNRLIAIKGSRGSGKTTLLLQIAQLHLPLYSTLYVSLDHIYFFEEKLYDLTKQFSQFGGTHLLLDEIHKYPNWSREIKLIYDNFPELTIIFTSSSMLEIYKSQSYLSRRAVTYNLKELSFREFVLFETNKTIPALSLTEILVNHNRIATEILIVIKQASKSRGYQTIWIALEYRTDISNFKIRSTGETNISPFTT